MSHYSFRFVSRVLGLLSDSQDPLERCRPMRDSLLRQIEGLNVNAYWYERMSDECRALRYDHWRRGQHIARLERQLGKRRRALAVHHREEKRLRERLGRIEAAVHGEPWPGGYPAGVMDEPIDILSGLMVAAERRVAEAEQKLAEAQRQVEEAWADER